MNVPATIKALLIPVCFSVWCWALINGRADTQNRFKRSTIGNSMRLLPFQKYTKNGQKEIVLKYVSQSLWEERGTRRRRRILQLNTTKGYNHWNSWMTYWMTFNTNDKETQGLINSELNEEITGQLKQMELNGDHTRTGTLNKGKEGETRSRKTQHKTGTQVWQYVYINTF